MSKKQNILVCPLDWGLGHATRLVPVIDLLLKKGVNVFIGADNSPLAYLQQRFPECKFIKFPGFSPKYPGKGSMAIAMLRAFPEMLSEAEKAQKLLQRLIKENQIDVVVSDNRYELSSDLAYCVFMTHQLNIQTPGISSIGKPFIQKKIKSYIRQFDELWIPDFKDEPNLSGELSHVPEMPISNSHFIGPLSRFSLVNPISDDKKSDLLVLLSGPEPQRTIMEEMLIKQASKTRLQTSILQGKPGSSKIVLQENITLIPHLPDESIAGLIKNAKTVICRPGYSTIMDLAVLGKKAIFIPTPGQTEQEYLAKRYQKLGICYSSSQSNFNLSNALGQNGLFSGFPLSQNSDTFQKTINNLLSRKV